MISGAILKRQEDINRCLIGEGFNHYKIIHLSDQEQKECYRSGCSCGECLQNLESKIFDNPGCRFVSEPHCLCVPLFFSNRPFGFLITGLSDDKMVPIELLTNLEDYFSKYSYDLYRQFLCERSVVRWKKPILHIGDHKAILEAHEKLVRFSISKSPVLLTGETGVGKELFARSLALMGHYWEKSFYTVNCGQFHDENMMVSELFGHCKGSFTGAASDHEGIFQQADGGTIFLDEIGELSLNAQKMLLRVIDQQEIKPLGSKKIKHVDVWVISATHRNLRDLVAKGYFREDLYYRISGLSIHIPALRERGYDRIELANHFLEKLNEEYGILKQFSPDVTDLLLNYDYPGNIRELKNLVENGFWMSKKNIIEISDIQSIIPRTSDQTNDLEILYKTYAARFQNGEDFWNTLFPDFKRRSLNVDQMRYIIKKDLTESGQYVKLIKKYNLPKTDYLKFMDFLRHHKLKPH